MSSSTTLASSLFSVVYQLAFLMGKGWQGKRSRTLRPQGHCHKGGEFFSDKVPIAKMSVSAMALQVILFSDGEEHALLLQDETSKTWQVSTSLH